MLFGSALIIRLHPTLEKPSQIRSEQTYALQPRIFFQSFKFKYCIRFSKVIIKFIGSCIALWQLAEDFNSIFIIPKGCCRGADFQSKLCVKLVLVFASLLLSVISCRGVRKSEKKTKMKSLEDFLIFLSHRQPHTQMNLPSTLHSHGNVRFSIELQHLLYTCITTQEVVASGFSLKFLKKEETNLLTTNFYFLEPWGFGSDIYQILFFQWNIFFDCS